MFNGTQIKTIKTNNYDYLYHFDQWKALSFADLQYQNHNGETFLLSEDQTNIFKLSRYALHNISGTFNANDWRTLETLLIENEIEHSRRAIPPGYYKNQRTWLYIVSLNVFHLKGIKDFELIDFGHSYGEIQINKIQCGISHGGGTWSGTDLGIGIETVKWSDFASGLHLTMQKEAVQIFKSIIQTATKKGN
jgi:hypothetical protein